MKCRSIQYDQFLQLGMTELNLDGRFSCEQENIKGWHLSTVVDICRYNATTRNWPGSRWSSETLHLIFRSELEISQPCVPSLKPKMKLDQIGNGRDARKPKIAPESRGPEHFEPSPVSRGSIAQASHMFDSRLFLRESP
jgi:hypothetical protein